MLFISSSEISRETGGFNLCMRAYMSSFMIIAILLSVIYKDSVLSLSTSMILWVSSVFLLLPISKLIATLVYPIPKSMILTGEEEKNLVRDIIANHYSLMDTISTISPSYSFQKLGRYILDPYSRAITFQMPIQTEPLPLAESLLLAWPSIVVLLVFALLAFIASYILFMRQDIR